MVLYPLLNQPDGQTKGRYRLMSENPPQDLAHTLRERGAHYVVDTQGQPVAVLLTLEEYQHYLDMLDDEADSQDAELAARLEQAAEPTRGERISFQAYLDRRTAPHDQEIQS
jgi:PHD/YefM family antitoxin component YafN of YafNO toxin-antitoxin module